MVVTLNRDKQFFFCLCSHIYARRSTPVTAQGEVHHKIPPRYETADAIHPSKFASRAEKGEPYKDYEIVFNSKFCSTAGHACLLLISRLVSLVIVLDH